MISANSRRKKKRKTIEAVAKVEVTEHRAAVMDKMVAAQEMVD